MHVGSGGDVCLGSAYCTVECRFGLYLTDCVRAALALGPSPVAELRRRRGILCPWKLSLLV